MRTIQIISINHQHTNSDTRITLNLSEEKWEELFHFIDTDLGVNGRIQLRTCNRVELFYESYIDRSKEVIEKWVSLSKKAEPVNSKVFQVYSGYHDCMDHLLQLSVGFKSAIFGDDQILSQLKKAFEQGRRSGSMSTLLERAYQTIMRFHKQVCRETDFKSQTVSLAYKALKSARDNFGAEALKSKNVLIVGAGDMAAQIAKYCPKFTFNRIVITNRTLSKAEKLAKHSNLNVVPYEDVDTRNYEIIISCTDQGFARIKDWSNVAYYIDLSLFSSQIQEVSVPHILLSELQEIIGIQSNKRKESVEKVDGLLAEKVLEYAGWCYAWKERSQMGSKEMVY